MFGQSLKKRAMSNAGGMLSKSGLIGSLIPRRAIILRKEKGSHREVSSEFVEVPQYITEMAEKADLGAWAGVMKAGLARVLIQLIRLFFRQARQILVCPPFVVAREIAALAPLGHAPACQPERPESKCAS